MTGPVVPAAPSVPPARMFLDSPRHGDYHVDGALLVQGWVLSPAGARSAALLVRGRTVAEVAITEGRPDVQRVFPEGGLAQGFRLEFDPTPWRGRAIRVRLQVALADGGSLAQTAVVLVSWKPRPGWLGFLASRILSCGTARPGDCWPLLWRAVRHLRRDFRVARMTGRVDRHLLPARVRTASAQAPWAPTAAERNGLAERAARLASGPSFTVVVLAAGAAAADRERTLAALAAQVLAPCQVLTVDGGTAAPEVPARTGECLAKAQAEFVVFLDAGDVLPPHALLHLGEAAADGAADVVYSDECRMQGGTLRDPFFKPDWSPSLLLAQPYCLRLCAWRLKLLRSVGGVEPAAADAWELDLALRATEAATARVKHVPEVLVYRAGPRPAVSSRSAAVVAAAAARRGLRAEVHPTPDGRCHTLRLTPTRAQPITAVIPTRDRLPLLRACVESLLRHTRYPLLQVLVVDNGSREPDTLAWLAQIARQGVRVHRDDRPFNYSALNNAAVAVCDTPCVLFLNNDVCAVEPRWLDELAALLELPDVVAAGARLLYGDDTIQHAGVALGIGRVAAHPHKRFDRRDPGYHGLLHSLREVSAATAACLLVRTDAFRAVGGFDENLAVAFNDVDLCLRLREAGGRILWTPAAVLRHFESVSRGFDRRGHERFEHEVAWMQRRWGAALLRDPYYSPRLSPRATDYRPEDERWAAPRAV